MPIARPEAETLWETQGTWDAVEWHPRARPARRHVGVTQVQPDGKTSPEELIAAAHASCFAMALTLVLGENHTPFWAPSGIAGCGYSRSAGVRRACPVDAEG
jgi:osmotically inducible protein OsmC